MSAAFSWDCFRALPVVGILRGFTLKQVTQIVPAAIRGGLRNIEVTMNTPDAPAQIREVVALGGGLLNVGAGTVINLALLDQAMAAGASFVVTPIVELDVLTQCVQQKIPVFPGALTPTEILRAWEMGATMVKVFPAESVGSGYIRALKGPLPQVKLLPTGGVDLKTLHDFVAAGADGFGVGSPLFDRRRIEAADWSWVEAQCRAFAESYHQALSKL